MRNAAVLALLGPVLLLTGCGDLLSLHPLYTDRDRVFDLAVEGRWETDDDVLTVSREDDAYTVTLQSKKDPSERSQYEIHLVDIKGVRFADLLPAEGIGHMFLKVRVAEGQLHLAFLDSEWLRQRVPHEQAEVAKGEKQAVLTAPTPELRKLVEQYALEPKAYDKQEVVYRRPR
jgi:hypothetical protein